MPKKSQEIDYNQPLADALNVLIGQDDSPENLRRAHAIIRAAFKGNIESIPFPILNIGKKLMEVFLRDAMEDGEYRSLFKKFANQPYRLTKILLKKDPERFFDFFLVAWNLNSLLSEFLHGDEDFEDDNNLDEKSGKTSSSKDVSKGEAKEMDLDRKKQKTLIETLKENIEYLDEDDIFEMAIPLFKQLSDKEIDGFQKGYNALLTLLEGIEDEDQVSKIERVFDRFQELIEMKFGQFRPQLKRKNFPYITVRRAIKEMEKAEGERSGSRRFARFDTRTGKTSLALLEPEYLKKKHCLYICPPDTIPTILREYKLYGGDESKIKVVRTNDDLKELIKENGNINYCIVPSTLLIKIEHGSEDVTTEEDESDIEAMVDGIERDPDDDQDGNGFVSIDQMKEYVNPLLLDLFEGWNPDYIAVDEARHFTGYHSEPNIPSSKRSQALLYLLNNSDTIKRDVTVRLLDATPGDLPRHFYPLISVLHPKDFNRPEQVRENVGTKPYVLMSLFSQKTDNANRDQVYNSPPIKENAEGTPVKMNSLQRTLYDYAAKYSTRNILHRLTLARIATFNPALLRPLFKRLIKPLRKKQFLSSFNEVYREWKVRSSEGVAPFDLNFIAEFGDRELLLNLFTFNKEHFEKHFKDDSEMFDVYHSIFNHKNSASCKAEFVINHLKDVLSKVATGEKYPSRIIVYSNFKKGLTREHAEAEEGLNLEKMLADEIAEAVPGISIFTIDGGVSSQIKKNGFSARDEVRHSWRDDNGINVLVAVGPATCQGIDLSVGDQIIEEIYLDSPMDSRLGHQISSRTIGPHQKRSVRRIRLEAEMPGKKCKTIDNGIKNLLTAKHFFSELVCSKPVAVSQEFLKAIEENVSFLGMFCDTEKTEGEVVETTRKDVKKKLKNKSKK